MSRHIDTPATSTTPPEDVLDAEIANIRPLRRSVPLFTPIPDIQDHGSDDGHESSEHEGSQDANTQHHSPELNAAQPNSQPQPVQAADAHGTNEHEPSQDNHMAAAQDSPDRDSPETAMGLDADLNLVSRRSFRAVHQAARFQPRAMTIPRYGDSPLVVRSPSVPQADERDAMEQLWGAPSRLTAPCIDVPDRRRSSMMPIPPVPVTRPRFHSAAAANRQPESAGDLDPPIQAVETTPPNAGPGGRSHPVGPRIGSFTVPHLIPSHLEEQESKPEQVPPEDNASKDDR